MEFLNPKNILIPEIHSDFQGFNKISELYSQALNTEEKLVFDFSRSRPIEANMCAVLGLILEVLKQNGKKFSLKLDERSKTNITLSKNGFYNMYCNKKLLDDIFKTTIDYKIFINDINLSFSKYTSEFFQSYKNGLSLFKEEILKKFRRSLGEVAINTKQHSESKIFVTCGQLFPNEGKLKFTMSDAGIGFAEHIKINTGLEMDSKTAIKWALTGNNTARPIQHGVPGGLGLKSIREFIEDNKGELYIVSHEGWYQNVRGSEYSQNIHYAFPGTIVSLAINCS
jgi:uncharacterized protein YlbG (UPF0298 family)